MNCSLIVTFCVAFLACFSLGKSAYIEAKDNGKRFSGIDRKSSTCYLIASLQILDTLLSEYQIKSGAGTSNQVFRDLFLKLDVFYAERDNSAINGKAADIQPFLTQTESEMGDSSEVILTFIASLCDKDFLQKVVFEPELRSNPSQYSLCSMKLNTISSENYYLPFKQTKFQPQPALNLEFEAMSLRNNLYIAFEPHLSAQGHLNSQRVATRCQRGRLFLSMTIKQKYSPQYLDNIICIDAFNKVAVLIPYSFIIHNGVVSSCGNSGHYRAVLRNFLGVWNMFDCSIVESFSTNDLSPLMIQGVSYESSTVYLLTRQEPIGGMCWFFGIPFEKPFDIYEAIVTTGPCMNNANFNKKLAAFIRIGDSGRFQVYIFPADLLNNLNKGRLYTTDDLFTNYASETSNVVSANLIGPYQWELKFEGGRKYIVVVNDNELSLMKPEHFIGRHMVSVYDSNFEKRSVCFLREGKMSPESMNPDTIQNFDPSGHRLVQELVFEENNLPQLFAAYTMVSADEMERGNKKLKVKVTSLAPQTVVIPYQIRLSTPTTFLCLVYNAEARKFFSTYSPVLKAFFEKLDKESIKTGLTSSSLVSSATFFVFNMALPFYDLEKLSSDIFTLDYVATYLVPFYNIFPLNTNTEPLLAPDKSVYVLKIWTVFNRFEFVTIIVDVLGFAFLQQAKVVVVTLQPQADGLTLVTLRDRNGLFVFQTQMLTGLQGSVSRSKVPVTLLNQPFFAQVNGKLIGKYIFQPPQTVGKYSAFFVPRLPTHFLYDRDFTKLLTVGPLHVPLTLETLFELLLQNLGWFRLDWNLLSAIELMLKSFGVVCVGSFEAIDAATIRHMKITSNRFQKFADPFEPNDFGVYQSLYFSAPSLQTFQYVYGRPGVPKATSNFMNDPIVKLFDVDSTVSDLISYFARTNDFAEFAFNFKKFFNDRLQKSQDLLCGDGYFALSNIGIDKIDSTFSSSSLNSPVGEMLKETFPGIDGGPALKGIDPTSPGFKKSVLHSASSSSPSSSSPSSSSPSSSSPSGSSPSGSSISPATRQQKSTWLPCVLSTAAGVFASLLGSLAMYYQFRITHGALLPEGVPVY